ncbi:MAG: AAA family ATPase, partial [Ruminococcus sp.]|nr:AAA family ATPase [Ruminococcus sp.]
MNQYKPIPIGIEDFKEIIDKGSYYVDKTKMIQELLDNSAKVYLFTRPRRFGKTLNISML